MNTIFAKTINIAFVLVLLGAPTVSCSGAKEKPIPGANIAGIRTPITRILISPLAFDAAIVAVEGLAHDVHEENLNGEEKTIFKLSDLKGNYINIVIDGSWDIYENDYLIVGGVYRRAKNEIEATQLEKIKLEEE